MRRVSEAVAVTARRIARTSSKVGAIPAGGGTQPSLGSKIVKISRQVSGLDVGGRSWAVAGIVKVGVVAELRGHGLGTRLLAFADDTLRAQGQDDLGLLVTSEDRLGYYGRLGWGCITGPVYYEDRG